MAVFKIEKNNNYTVISNYHLRDKKLSYKAKGLLSFMLSLPENWDYSMNGLVSVSKESLKSIRTILQELEEYKYLIRERYQNEKGQFQYNYSIYEIPYDQLPYTLSPHMGLPHSDNGLQINTNKINTNKQDKLDKQLNEITNELIKRHFIEETDLNIYSYNDLFNNLLEQYSYKQIIISTNYVISKWFENKGLDENNEPIKNKFSYFKKALENNLIKMTTDIELDWEI